MPDYRKLSKEWKYVRIPKDILSFCPGDGPPIFVLKNNVMGKLQPDYITWTLSVNADGLQKEMLEVRNNTKELKAENMRLKSSMEKLAMQGKLQSKEYKELNAQFKANSRTISENGEKLRLLESRLNNTDKSYAQLSKQARQLRRELDNTVKSLQPQEYARLEAELAKTKEAMEQLRPKAEAVKESFFSLTRMKSAVVGFFAGIGASAGSFFANSISEARSWMSEGIRLAANADGVRRAFDKLDRPGMLSELRKATKDTVNDLELMQAAVRAKDFRIPLEDLGKYLQFARLKAQQTGQSVDYLTDSIITGLGRKSLLILDNLGLSAAEVNEEMAKTGDLMAAVAAIVDRQLAQAGRITCRLRTRPLKKPRSCKTGRWKSEGSCFPCKKNGAVSSSLSSSVFQMWRSGYWNIKKASLRLSPWLPVLFWFIKRLFFCKKHGTGF